MPVVVSTIDESITEAKHALDAARRDGKPADIALWVARMNARLDRKSSLMKAAAQHLEDE